MALNACFDVAEEVLAGDPVIRKLLKAMASHAQVGGADGGVAQ